MRNAGCFETGIVCAKAGRQEGRKAGRKEGKKGCWGSRIRMIIWWVRYSLIISERIHLKYRHCA